MNTKAYILTGPPDGGTFSSATNDAVTLDKSVAEAWAEARGYAYETVSLLDAITPAHAKLPRNPPPCRHVQMCFGGEADAMFAEEGEPAR